MESKKLTFTKKDFESGRHTPDPSIDFGMRPDAQGLWVPLHHYKALQEVMEAKARDEALLHAEIAYLRQKLSKYESK